MKQAFLILAHKNPAQLERLVDYFLLNNCFVLIHIDEKSFPEFINFKSKYAGNENVKIYSVYKVYWGSFNQIQASYLLLEKCFEFYKFDYVHLISAQDLPVKKIAELNAFLTNAKGKDFVHIFNSQNTNTWHEQGGLRRMKLFWIMNYPQSLEFLFSKINVVLHLLQNFFKLYRRIDFKINGGSNWFTLSYKTTQSVLNYIKSNPNFYNRFKYTRCADEIFLASILLNAGLESNVNTNYLRFIDWQTGPEYPRTFRIEDLQRLKSLQNVFFARKFDEKTDSFVINQIYSEILNK